MAQVVLSSTQLDDTSHNITYAGAVWTFHQNVDSIYHLYNNTDTFTDVQGATATLQFYGNAIEYWGNRGPYHGNCSITIDGQELAVVNSHEAADDTPILLYSTNQLALTDHTFVITVLDPAYPAVCEVDRFVVNVTTNPTTTGLYSNTAFYPTGSVASGGGGGGTGTTSSSPPIAVIAGAVGGVAVLSLLLLAFWWYKRSKKNKNKNGMIGLTKSKLEKSAAARPLLADGPPSPSLGAIEKGRTPQTYSNHPSSYVPSSPPPSSDHPGSPAPSTIGFNPYLTPHNPGTLSPPPSSVGGTAILPNSSQAHARPMSITSSTSGAPTTSFHSGAPTTEGSSFTGYYSQSQQPPLPQQQQPFQHYQAPQPQYQQQPGADVIPPWAIPEQPSSPPLSAHAQHLSAPSPSQSPVPVVSRPSPSGSPAPVSYPPEKAQYMPRNEKAAFGGARAGDATAGASGSSAPVPISTTEASGSGPNAQPEDALPSPIPDAPPPAYQL